MFIYSITAAYQSLALTHSCSDYCTLQTCQFAHIMIHSAAHLLAFNNIKYCPDASIE